MILLPFDFKRFSSNNYFLSNVVGEFIFLSEIHFKMLTNEDFECMPDRLINLLLSHHFICHKDDFELTIDLLANKLRTKKDFLSWFTSLHMIVLTLRCNCSCDYCHASSKGISKDAAIFDMDKETARKSVDAIFNTPSPFIKIEFQGGEPLLNWGVLKYIVQYAEDKNKYLHKQLSFVICTNLLAITTEQIDFIQKHNIDISTSCDGTKKLHDNHRHSLIGSSSYNAFIQNLNLCESILGKGAVSALLTVTKDNLYHLREIIDHYISLGFKNIFIRALNPYGYAIENKDRLSYSVDEFIEKYLDALQYIIDLNAKGVYFVDSYASLLLQRILTPFPTGFVDLQSPSGAGIAGVIYYYNGDVYPTDESRMLATTNDKSFLMGNVHKNSYLEIFNGKIIHNLALNSCVETLPGCYDCPYKIYCGADPIRYYVECNDIVGKRYNSEFCKKNKAIITKLISYLQEAEPTTINIFWSWINKSPLGDCYDKF